jgi:hypothetical protein
MKYLDSFKKLAGVESRLPTLPARERKGPDPLPAKLPAKRGISEEQRRLAGLVRPQMRGAADVQKEKDR